MAMSVMMTNLTDEARGNALRNYTWSGVSIKEMDIAKGTLRSSTNPWFVEDGSPAPVAPVLPIFFRII